MRILGFRVFAAVAMIGACIHLGAGDGFAQVSARDLQVQENAVKMAEQQRQRADQERARLVEAYRELRTESARSMKIITDRIQALEAQKKQTQTLADSPQKQQALQRIEAEEKRLLAEGEKMRTAAAAAQKSRADATVNLQKAQAIETAAKEQLARMRSGQPAAAPAAVVPVAARTAAAPAAPSPQALVNARMDVEAAEKALAVATLARQKAEAASSDDAKDLTRQLSLVAEQRKRIEAIEDAAKREALLKQSHALETRIKGELQQASAPVAAAQKTEADARARFDHASAMEIILRTAATQAAR